MRLRIPFFGAFGTGEAEAEAEVKNTFNPGPPTNPRRLKNYGAFRLGDANKRWRLRRGVKPTKDSALWRFAKGLVPRD